MKVFLIILAVLLLLILLIISIKAEFTVIFDNGWTTKIKVLFIEKDIKLTKLLSFLVAPDKAGQEAAQNSKDRKNKVASDGGQDNTIPDEKLNKADKEPDKEEKGEETAGLSEETAPEITEPAKSVEVPKAEITVADETTAQASAAEPVEESKAEKKRAKPNPIQKIWNEEGIVGIMSLVTNLIQTANTAITTLIKGLHIYSLYVKMIIGGGDAATIGEKYGAICGWYYPLKGMIMNQMKVDEYDDLIIPDFIAPRSEYELQFIGSISVGLLLKMLLKAGAKFVINFIKNK